LPSAPFYWASSKWHFLGAVVVYLAVAEAAQNCQVAAAVLVSSAAVAGQV